MGAKVALRVFRKNDECQFSKTKVQRKNLDPLFELWTLLFGL